VGGDKNDDQEPAESRGREGEERMKVALHQRSRNARGKNGRDRSNEEDHSLGGEGGL